MREDATPLIPFYLNGTLSPSEAEAVEAALLEDEAAREAFFQWLEVKRALDGAGRSEAAPADPARFLAKLKKRSTLYIPFKRASARYLRVPAWAWQPAAVIIVALQLLALGLFVAGISVEKGSDYRVLTAPHEDAAVGETFNVVFHPEATEQEIRTLLLAYRAQFVEGPNKIGLYRIQFSGAVREKLDRFQKEPIVRFLEKNL